MNGLQGEGLLEVPGEDPCPVPAVLLASAAAAELGPGSGRTWLGLATELVPGHVGPRSAEPLFR